jgi:hypothetical protein
MTVKGVTYILLFFVICFYSKVFCQETSEIRVEVNVYPCSDANSNDGSLEILKIEGGNPPYEIHWFGYKVNNLNKLRLEGLCKGRYVLIVEDKDKKIGKFEFKIDCKK